MKQSSIEWIEGYLKKFNYIEESLALRKAFEKAKEMHKQEIVDATLYGWRRSTEVNSIDPNEFYNETFKSE